MAEVEDAGNVVTSPAAHAESFMTEFNQNAQILGQLLVPWVNRISEATSSRYFWPLWGF